jgi:hypothetical protein
MVASVRSGVQSMRPAPAPARSSHPFLDAADISLGDHPRPEGMAQVMKPERAGSGARERGGVATAQSRAVEVVAGLTAEDEVVIAGPVFSLPKPC